MIAGRTIEHGKKISDVVKARYEADIDGKYGFRARRNKARSKSTRAKLAALSLVQWNNMTPEQHVTKLKIMREGMKGKTMMKIIQYDGKTFFHPNEISCYKFLLALGIDRNEIAVNFPLGLKNIDFFVENTFFWEHHVCNAFDKLTRDEYYKRRRIILDTFGYGTYPLVVTVSNDELNSDLKACINLLRGWKMNERCIHKHHFARRHENPRTNP